MAIDHTRANCFLSQLLRTQSPDDLSRRLIPTDRQPATRVPLRSHPTAEGLAGRWQLLAARPESRRDLADPESVARMGVYRHHIENFIGCVKLPVGLAGPLRVNGLFAQGDYYVPLATTEAALVASYSRGAQLISEAGGCTALLLNEGMCRAPGFAFVNLQEVGRFLVWALSQVEAFRLAAAETTRHGNLVNMRIAVEGNHVYLVFEFTTGDAAGQNMVTIATETICRYIADRSPVRPRYFFLEANLSGDKKVSAQSFLSVRGRKVSVEVVIPRALVRKRLHTTPERLTE
jgi:hydroxymethylglutaryl-CoA reductase (NADPH)